MFCRSIQNLFRVGVLIDCAYSMPSTWTNRKTEFFYDMVNYNTSHNLKDKI